MSSDRQERQDGLTHPLIRAVASILMGPLVVATPSGAPWEGFPTWQWLLGWLGTALYVGAVIEIWRLIT